MGVSLNAGGQCLRFLLIAWNVFVFLIGAAAVGLGIWQLVVSNDYEFLTGEEYASGGILSIVAGVIAIIVAALGIIGAIALWRVALVIYSIIVSVFIILELISGILGFVYRDTIEDRLDDNARDAIKKFTNESDARTVINTIQDDFECCGWDNYSDWDTTFFFTENNMYPESCECDDDNDDEDGDDDDDDDCRQPDNTLNQTIYTTGCRDSVVDVLEEYQLVIGAVGIVFALLQILVVLFACILCGCIHKAKGEYTTV